MRTQRARLPARRSGTDCPASLSRPHFCPSQEQPLPNPLLLQDVEALGPLDDLQDGLHLGRAEALAPPLLLCLVGVHRPAGVQPGESIAHKSSPDANRCPHHTHQGPSTVCMSGARQSPNAASATHQLLGPMRTAARPQHLVGSGAWNVQKATAQEVSREDNQEKTEHLDLSLVRKQDGQERSSIGLHTH